MQKQNWRFCIAFTCLYLFEFCAGISMYRRWGMTDDDTTEQKYRSLFLNTLWLMSAQKRRRGEIMPFPALPSQDLKPTPQQETLMQLMQRVELEEGRTDELRGLAKYLRGLAQQIDEIE